ncbi:unnamed protein product [Effrenium voratum]|uniref:Uncharacterized protein n=1 Tax=Effrenium voratum TaxID=2562239 RepID=A0AA36MR68_9DINO|nr:unnamed protein product [Effrenium voratum]
MALEVTVNKCCKIGSQPDSITVSIEAEVVEQLSALDIDVATHLQATIDAFWEVYESDDLDTLKAGANYTELFIEKVYEVRVKDGVVTVMFSPRCVGGTHKGPACGDCGGDYDVKAKRFDFIEE